MGKRRRREVTARASAPSDTSSIPLPLPFDTKSHPVPPAGEFLRNRPPFEPSFAAALATSYRGFCTDSSSDLAGTELDKSSVKTAGCSGGENGVEEMDVQDSLRSIHSWYRTDVTQPFGLTTPCAKTYVTRCLVGDPGTTYKYLGLRMFAHDWNKDTGTTGAKSREKKFLPMGRLAKILGERTRHHLDDYLSSSATTTDTDATANGANFNVCLINCMDATVPLKTLESGRCTVSWHADSSLEHYSTIAVYQTIMTETKESSLRKPVVEPSTPSSSDATWEVALRVAPHSEGPTRKTQQSAVDSDTPPLAVALPSGYAYYLLHDFNHHHQHAVLCRKTKKANNTKKHKNRQRKQNKNSTPTITNPMRRYSCTFRVIRATHTRDAILGICATVCGGSHKKGAKQYNAEQSLLTEIESEWIRQFYIQGTGHKKLLWEEWGAGIQELCRYWGRLESRTYQTVELLRLAAEGVCPAEESGHQHQQQKNEKSKQQRKLRAKRSKAAATVTELSQRNTHDVDLFQLLADYLIERAQMRKGWAQREQDPVFAALPEDYQPIPVPFQFHQASSNGHETSRSGGASPLPGSSDELEQLAKLLQGSGRAFKETNVNLLPDYGDLLRPVMNEKEGNSAEEDSPPHSKPMDWSGWGEEPIKFALEMQDPWARQLLEGRKRIETRAYPLPPAMVGRKIWILESRAGEAGVSTLGNTISVNTNSLTKVVGWCVFGSVKKYTSTKEFRTDESLHRVKPNSGYDYREGKDLFGWVVEECSQELSEAPFHATRRFRSLFELVRVEGSSKRKKKPKGTNGKKKRRF